MPSSATALPVACASLQEQACFAGLDGNLQLEALAPRHLEACATRSCQILIEGAYNGVLRPGEHYIELKRDFSNLDDVVGHVKRDDLRAAINEQAYHDIVASGRYSYRCFVRHVIDTALAERPATSHNKVQAALFARAERDDGRSWRRVRMRSATTRPLLARLASSRLGGLVRRLIKRPS